MRTIYRDIVGALIFSKDNKLLIGKGGVYANAWIIPGGGIEKGESEIDALKREVAEETGIIASDSQIEKIDFKHSGSSEKKLRDTGENVIVEMNFFNYIIRLDTNADETVVKTDDDFINPRWLSVDEFNTTALSAPTVVTLKHLGYM